MSAGAAGPVVTRSCWHQDRAARGEGKAPCGRLTKRATTRTTHGWRGVTASIHVLALPTPTSAPTVLMAATAATLPRSYLGRDAVLVAVA